MIFLKYWIELVMVDASLSPFWLKGEVFNILLLAMTLATGFFKFCKILSWLDGKFDFIVFLFCDSTCWLLFLSLRSFGSKTLLLP